MVFTRRPRPRVLLRREHLHARAVDPRVQGELLQVHQRDPALPRGRGGEQRARARSRACNGTTAGGGYELALACDEIVLVDDGNSAVSFPETPLLAVLPGTGGLTRLVDKRKVRRDRADVFCTIAEGIKGKRAEDWGLVDTWSSRIEVGRRGGRRARRRSPRSRPVTRGPAFELPALDAEDHAPTSSRYKYVELAFDRAQRTAALTVRGPDGRRGPRRARDDRRDSRGRCARSASSTTRCSGCASTTRRSASSRCAPRGDRRPGRRAYDEALAQVDRLASRARSGCSSAACSSASTTRRAASSRSPTPRTLLRRLAARARARRRPLLHADRRRRDDRGRRPRSRTPAVLDHVERACRGSSARFYGEPGRVAEGPRARRRGPDRRRRRPSSSASRRSPPTTSTGTTSCASRSRSARRCRPTR